MGFNSGFKGLNYTYFMAVGRFLDFNWFPAFRKMALPPSSRNKHFFIAWNLNLKALPSIKWAGGTHTTTQSHFPEEFSFSYTAVITSLRATPPWVYSVIKPQTRQNILVAAILLFLSGERITGVTCTFIYMCVIQVPAFDGVPVAPNHSLSARHFVFTDCGN